MSVHDPSADSRLHHAFNGALAGLICGLLGLFVGGLRWAWAFISGAAIDTRGLLGGVVVYLLSFGAAGTVIGILWTRPANRGRFYLAWLAGGAVIGCAATGLMSGAPNHWAGADWCAFIGVTAFVGVVGARTWRRRAMSL